MMLLSEMRFMKSLSLVGLGRKNQNIKRLSQILVEKYDGAVPQNIENLEQLPGVGHKTASVVVSQTRCAGIPVDTHIHRCAQRWGLTNGKNVQQTEKDLKKFSQKKIGINSIFKLLCMQEIFVRQEPALAGM